MSSAKDYAYFIKGNNLAIIEKDTSFDNDPNSRDYGPGAGVSQYKSPLSSSTSGIEIEYVYSPKYWVNNSTINQAVTHFSSVLDDQDEKYYLALKREVASDDGSGQVELYPFQHENYEAGTYILLRNANEFTGVHKIRSYQSNERTEESGTTMVLDTIYGGNAQGSWSALNANAMLYYGVNMIVDETDDIPVPEYLSKAVVYYVKAKLMEDMGKFEEREYFLREFRKSVEKHESSRIAGPRRVMTGLGAIR